MKKDSIIKENLEKIEKELEALKEKNVQKKFKTNLNYHGENLRVKPIQDLLITYGLIENQNEVYKKTANSLTPEFYKSNQDYVVDGFSSLDWLSDIKQLINTKMIVDRKNKLNMYKKKLESLYSQEAKDEIELNNIINDL